MSEPVAIGRAPWKRRDMIEALEAFTRLYRQRPIQDNTGGMFSPHMFAFWFALKTLKPAAVIESGVWLGQGTWFIEQACPSAKLYCIDLNLKRIQYRSERAVYYDRDFTAIDWHHVPLEETILFFDDHQNAFERVKAAHGFGFKQLIFEDNYPPSKGDCYSLKKAFMHTGFQPRSPKNGALRTRLAESFKRLFGMSPPPQGAVAKTDQDARYLFRNLETYYEFPPVFKSGRTRWGDVWEDRNYPTPPPLLSRVDIPFQRLFLDEAVYYTWICYAKLR